jgi:hypothetical protein
MQNSSLEGLAIHLKLVLQTLPVTAGLRGKLLIGVSQGLLEETAGCKLYWLTLVTTKNRVLTRRRELADERTTDEGYDYNNENNDAENIQRRS